MCIIYTCYIEKYVSTLYLFKIYITHIFKSHTPLPLVFYILNLICELIDFVSSFLALSWRLIFGEWSCIIKYTAGTFLLEMRLVNCKIFPQNFWTFDCFQNIIVISNIAFFGKQRAWYSIVNAGRNVTWFQWDHSHPLKSI